MSHEADCQKRLTPKEVINTIIYYVFANAQQAGSPSKQMVNGCPILFRALGSVGIASALPLLPFTHARSESINADSLRLQLLTARKKEWRPATAGSLPQAVTCQLKHTALKQD